MTDLPTRVSRYEVLSLIGQGGMGVLYLARDPVIDRHVALKLLKVDSEDLRRRFVREARSAGRLQHPSIVTVYDVGDHEGQLFIAMEYIDGDTLATLIRDEVPFSSMRKLEMVDQLCDGLGFAHQRGIVHRDIKPANVMVTRGGLVKVLDFGIARLAPRGSTAGSMAAGAVLGTPAYMAPEQLEGGPVDHRSDIFAVGLVMFELFSGRRAFTASSTQELLQKVVAADHLPLDRLVPHLDPDLVRCVHRALAREPEQRYQSLQELRNDLGRVRRRIELESGAFDATIVVQVPVLTRPVTPLVTAPPAPMPAVGAPAHAPTGTGTPPEPVSLESEADVLAHFTSERSRTTRPIVVPPDIDETIIVRAEAAALDAAPPHAGESPGATTPAAVPSERSVPATPAGRAAGAATVGTSQDLGVQARHVSAPAARREQPLEPDGDATIVAPVRAMSHEPSPCGQVAHAGQTHGVARPATVPPPVDDATILAPAWVPPPSRLTSEEETGPVDVPIPPPPAPAAASTPPPRSSVPTPARRSMLPALIIVAVLVVGVLVMGLAAYVWVRGALARFTSSGPAVTAPVADVQPTDVVVDPLAAEPTDVLAPTAAAASAPTISDQAVAPPAPAPLTSAVPAGASPVDRSAPTPSPPRPAAVPPAQPAAPSAAPVPTSASASRQGPGPAGGASVRQEAVAEPPPAAPPTAGPPPAATSPASPAVAASDLPALAPPPPPPPVAREDALTLVRAYVAARNTGHAAGLRRVWPSASDTEIRRITSDFSSPLTLVDCDVSGSAPARMQAACQFTQAGAAGPAKVAPLNIRRRMVFDMERQARGWVIAGVEN